MNRRDCIPDYTKEFFEYSDRFCDGTMAISLCEPSGKLAIGTYEVPDELLTDKTKEFLTDLIHKSLADNHDYLLDYAKAHGKEIVYEEGCNY